MSSFRTERLGAGRRVQPVALTLIALALMFAAFALCVSPQAVSADAEGIDLMPPSPKWLDSFCIGNEQCAVGDFNGDGKDDVLAFIRDTRGGTEQRDVWVALSSDLTFKPAQKWHDSFCTGADVCKTGDVNADGRDDIISFTQSLGDVSVALSTGSGFAGSSKWQEFFCPIGEVCEVGDFNGDNRVDIVAFTRNAYGDAGAGDVYIGLSSGSGFANGTKWHDFFCIGTELCSVGDFNGDGRDDIASFSKASSGNVWVGLSTGAAFGTGKKWHDFFCVGSETCGIGDFTGDGRDDIVTFLGAGYDAATIGDVYVAPSDGGGFLESSKWNEYFCLAYEVCMSGDFDGDGRADAIRFLRDTQLGENRGDVYVALSGGSASLFTTTGAKWNEFFCVGNEDCRTGDFNGDGRDDALLFVRDTQGGAGRGDVYAALSNGTSLDPGAKWAEFFCTGTNICKIGDVNADGRDDIIEFTRGSSADVLVALSTGNGFGPTSVWNSFFCGGNETCDVGDFNGDGRDDVVTFIRSAYGGADPNGTLGDVYVGLSNGYSFGGGVKWQEFFCIGDEQCAVGDFNGDGRDDVLTLTHGTSADAWVGLSSGSNFQSGVKWHDFFCPGTETCGVGDFNGDGRDDVVTFLKNGYDSKSAGDIFVAVSSGSGFAAGPKWHDFFCIGSEVCAIGDFDGDQLDDVATFLRSTQAGDKVGDVVVALGSAGHYYFSPSKSVYWVPFVRR